MSDVRLTMRVSLEVTHKDAPENDFDQVLRDVYEMALNEAAAEFFESKQEEIFDSIHAMVDLKVSGNVN